jgi:hypothetical protein
MIEYDCYTHYDIDTWLWSLRYFLCSTYTGPGLCVLSDVLVASAVFVTRPVLVLVVVVLRIDGGVQSSGLTGGCCLRTRNIRSFNSMR